MQSSPSNIEVDFEGQVLKIVWRDGHLSVLGLDGVRRSCPCAVCAGGHDQMGAPADPAVFDEPPRRDWTELSLSPVGNYALRIVWDDGHDAGIFTWQRLRDLCNCANCYPSNT